MIRKSVMKSLFLIILTTIFLLSTKTTNARTVNFDLAPQIENDPNRTLPQGPNYSLAGDLKFFWNISKPEMDYYHSGFWLNMFGEYRPLERMRLNLKLVAFNPSNSYGYNSPARVMPFLSAYYTESFFNSRLKGELVGFDLDRQTLAAGLLIDEKEMSGMIWRISVSDFRLSWIKPGTGVFNYEGDGSIQKLDFLNDLFGVYGAWLSLPEDETKAVSSDGDSQQVYRSPYEFPWTSFVGVFSIWKHSSGLFTALEACQRNTKAKAYLERVGFAWKHDILAGDVWVEHRQYDHEFFLHITGHTDQDYLTVEDRDKKFTNPMNIAPDQTSGRMATAATKMTLFPKGLYRVSTRNEFGYWTGEPGTDEPRRIHAYEHSVWYCPWPGKDSCGMLSYSNIISNANSSPTTSDEGYATMHRLVPHMRLEAQVLF